MICKDIEKQSYCLIVEPFVLVRMNFLKVTKQAERLKMLVNKFTGENPVYCINCDYHSGKLYIGGEYYRPQIACYYRGTDPKPN